jgi:hypothetical protein
VPIIFIAMESVTTRNKVVLAPKSRMTHIKEYGGSTTTRKVVSALS